MFIQWGAEQVEIEIFESLVSYFQIFQPRRERGRVFEAFKLRGQATVVPDKAGLGQHHIHGAGVDDHHGGDRGDDDGDNSDIYVIVF